MNTEMNIWLLKGWEYLAYLSNCLVLIVWLRQHYSGYSFIPYKIFGFNVCELYLLQL